MRLTEWSEKILRGDTRAVARAITAVENREAQGVELLKRLFSRTGRATLIGVTGAAGSGKSTLVDALVTNLRSKGHSVGVLAVDPTSPFTGGAMLGDRVRMQTHANDPGTYIRSMATRGSLGGLAAATLDAALVLDASGKEFILIETVGVGQDEVEIARLADVTLLLLVPNFGDDVQVLKAGVMEIADIFVVNKSDLDGTDRLEQDIRGVLSLRDDLGFASGHGSSGDGSSGHGSSGHGSSGHGFSHAVNAARSSGALAPEGQTTPTTRGRFGSESSHRPWRPPIVRTVATRAEGVEDLFAAILQYLDFAREHGALQQRRQEHWRARLLAMLREQALERAVPQALTDGVLDRHAAAIAAREMDPYSVADQILKQAGSPGESW